MVNLGKFSVSENSYNRARKIVDDKPEGKSKTSKDVLNSIRQMMPSWTVTTCASQWGNGIRNLEISESILERMAEDPEAMVKFKAIIFDLDEAVEPLEEWMQENEGKDLQFNIMWDQNDALTAAAVVRTLIGGESRTVFELPSDGLSWAEIIRQKLESLNEGQVEEADGSKSWMA